MQDFWNRTHGWGKGSQQIVGATLFLLILATLVWRLPLGIDLSDEAYYVIFVYDWLKGGIQTSSLTTLHQTALLLPYFVMRVYRLLTGSVDGLVLAIRIMFLFGTIAAALSWSNFLLRVDGRLQAWLGAIFALAFIPFGLPSVSYNTLGMQGMAIGLAAFGVAFCQQRLDGRWAVFSAIGWAVAVSAYPSMAGPLAATVLLAALTVRPLKQVLVYAGLVAVSQMVAWGLVIYALSLDKLLASIAYLSAINDVAGWHRKLAYTLRILDAHPIFVGCCVGAILVGILRHRIGVAATALATAFLVWVLFLEPAALFVRSHDVVTVLALTGIGHAFRMGNRHSIEERAIAVTWLVGFVAGLATMISAFNSIVNFPVGGAAAAVLALSGLPSQRPIDLLPRVLAMLTAIAGVLITSLTFYYGDLPAAPRPAASIDTGPFRGLLGQPEQVEQINWMRDAVAPLVGADNRIAFVGRLYGLLIPTAARPTMLAVFPLDETMNPKGLAMSRAFFQDPARRPSLVVVETDQYLIPFNPVGPCLETWYQPILQAKRPLGNFDVYRLAPATSVTEACQ